MALIKNLLFLTFDQNDERDEKLALLKMYLAQNYMVISETKINDTGEVKEWILQGLVKYGKFNASQQSVDKIIKFDPTRGMDG